VIQRRSSRKPRPNPTAKLTTAVTKLACQIDALRREVANLADAFHRWGRSYEERVPSIERPRRTGIDQPRRTELLAKIFAFLAGELARKEHRQCVSLHLIASAAPHDKREEIHVWTRDELPELFELASVELFAASLLEFAEKDVITRDGFCRYTVQTWQHLGSRQIFSFRLQALESFPRPDGAFPALESR